MVLLDILIIFIFLNCFLGVICSSEQHTRRNGPQLHQSNHPPVVTTPPEFYNRPGNPIPVSFHGDGYGCYGHTARVRYSTIFATSFSVNASETGGGETVDILQFVHEVQQLPSTLHPIYNYTAHIDEIYKTEIAPRFPPGHHYLDYTASGLYLQSQLHRMAHDLATNPYSNPHSVNPSAFKTTEVVEEMRRRILDFFGAHPEVYEMVFVRSATAALQKLGESFPFTSNSQFVYTISNHNSVLGIREYALAAGSTVHPVLEDDIDAWILRGAGFERNSHAPCLYPNYEQYDSYDQNLDRRPHRRDETWYNLFAFPGEDNFEGILYPLRWIQQIQAKSTPTKQWKVLLDAAAYVPKHKLNLTETPADYVCVSVNLLGLPTGVVGAWLVRKDATEFLHKKYWGGGSVFTATSGLFWHLDNFPPAKYEDGTLPFLDIVALKHGFDSVDLLGGMEAIEAHIRLMGAQLHHRLLALRHSNGAPLLKLHGKHDRNDWHNVQGAIANFQILKPDGSYFSYKTAALELADAGFYLRDGCMCNTVACYAAVGVSDEEVRDLALRYHHNFTGWEWITVERDGAQVTLPLGSLRASLGYMTRRQDVELFVTFLERKYRDKFDDSRPKEAEDRFYVEHTGGC